MDRYPSSSEDAQCSHCLLPLDARATLRNVHGEDHRFCCYGCCLAFQVRHGVTEESEATWLLIRLGVGGFLAMNVMLLSLLIYSGTFERADAELLPWIRLFLLVLATPVLIVLGGPYLRDAWRGLLALRPDSAMLISLGATAAYGYSALAVLRGSGEVYFDTATMLLLLFTVGRTLDAFGRARAVRSLAPLLEAESATALVVEDGIERTRPAREVAPGALVRIRPGERVPVDGIVVEGRAAVDEAVMTGESRSIDKAPGAALAAGAIVLDGPLLLRATAAVGDSRWARISRSVRAALARRSPIQRLVDRVAGLMVPFVLLLAALVVIAWSRSLPAGEALLIGLAVLVVACPCGLGLATPMAGSLGIGRLARQGALVRGGGVLEALSRVRLVAFDKTGTLTLGRPRLVALDTQGCTAEAALARAAGLERHAEHALARAIVEAAETRGVAPETATGVSVLPGRGLRGEIAGAEVAAGTLRWLVERGHALPASLAARAGLHDAAGHSLAGLAWGGEIRALLAFEDTPRPEAAEAVEALRRMGLHVVLLSGDRPVAVRRVAEALGIADWRAELGPEDKQVALEDLRQDHGAVAMVGDGINDGPVLAGADVGIAVASATDLARETADLVLPASGLRLLPWAVALARATRRTIVGGLAWAFGYNAVALSLAAAGLLQPIFAALVMAGSSLFVVLNALRLERFPEPEAAPAEATAQPKMSRVKASYQLSA